jgi:hypothetical protein
VLAQSDGPSTPSDLNAILNDAGALIRNSTGQKLEPLLVLSDEPNIRLQQYLSYEGLNVFFLDHDQLPGSSTTPKMLRFSPFLGAVRQKLSQRDLPALFFEPFRPGQPIKDSWRFFGRRPELERIVDSDQSFFLLGPRYIGKTSLLIEAAKRLKAAGNTVHFVPVQDLTSADQVVAAIVRALSLRDAEIAVRRQKAINETLLRSVLKTIGRESGRVILILDELGNVLQKPARRGDWNIMGALREYAHSGKLQILASGFQEFYIKQMEDAGGPFVNFAAEMKLGVFSDRDIDEFLVDTLALWGEIRNPAAFRELIVSRVGRQPLFLQYLGQALFAKVFERPQRDLESALLQILDRQLQNVFEKAVETIFYRAARPVIRYLFLQRCYEADSAKQEISGAEINDLWLKTTLENLGLKSNFDARRLLMDQMEMLALTTPLGSRSRQQILATLIWDITKESEPDIVSFIRTFAEEISQEDIVQRPGSSAAAV